MSKQVNEYVGSNQLRALCSRVSQQGNPWRSCRMAPGSAESIYMRARDWLFIS